MSETSEDHRQRLLDGLRRFVTSVRQLPGVKSIAVLGSIITAKPDPKDIDVLVVVADDADLAPLATAARRLQGHAQSFNRGADVFLADERGHTSEEHAAGETADPACDGRAMRCIAGDAHISTTISTRFA